MAKTTADQIAEHTEPQHEANTSLLGLFEIDDNLLKVTNG